MIFKNAYFEKYLQTAASENLSGSAILIFRKYFRSNSLSAIYKKRICRSPFSVKFFSKVFCKFSKQISLTQSLMLERYVTWVET